MEQNLIQLNMKNTITTLLLLATFSSFSQNISDNSQTKPKRFEFYFNGSFGLYFPTKASNALAKSGAVYTFQFQTNYKDNYFTRLFFDQYNVNYKDNFSINNLNFNIDDNVLTNTLGLDFGYTFIDSKKCSSYVFVGAGYAMMRTPAIQYDAAQNNVKTFSESNSFATFRGGVGVEYEFSRYFIIYLETNYSTIPYKTNLSDKPLNGIMTLIGFKTPLQ